MSYSEFTEKDYEMIRQEYATLLESAKKRCANEHEVEMVQKAFEFANEAHKNVRRRSGEPYMLHPIAVAKIVVDDIGLGYKSICAALLHDVVEDTDYTVDDIRNLFGDKVASLVDGLTKIKVVLDNEDKTKKRHYTAESMQAENFKRILLTLNDDVRVVLIKLADRLHNCRTIEFMPEFKRDKILSETMFIFIPLAHRLGLYEVKSEMENIWLKWKEPEAYESIVKNIVKNTESWNKEFEEFIAPISDGLKNAGFSFEILNRIKSPYSVWHKMQTKNIPFDQVYDLYAVRVIFNQTGKNESERDQCYHIFSIITGLYRYKADRVRDWVKHPKSNGYEALHCTVMSPSGIWIEVQIRSRRMDDVAEKGIAAHWAYKKEGYVAENDSEMDKWLEKVKEILVSPDVNALELLDIIHKDLTTSDIMVFTPQGEQKTVEKGSSVLDFAYMIHSQIGYHAIAAKVNKKLVPLSYVLRGGDQVEVITAEETSPKREWLSFLHTRHARNLVIDYFRTNKKEPIEMGRHHLEQSLGNLGYKLTNDVIRKLLDAYDVADKGSDELYFRIGMGMIDLGHLPDIMGRAEEKKSGWSFTSWFKNKVSSSSSKHNEEVVIRDQGDSGRRFVIATCCHPIPGDPVIGFKAPDGTVTIHKKSCNVAESIAAKHGDWVVIPKWEGSAVDISFPVRITLRGLDRVGLVNEISRYISLVMGINMKKIYLGTEGSIFEGYIELMVQDKDALETIMSKLDSIDGIQSVVRTDL